MLKNISSSPFIPPFSLKSICLMKREDERGMRGACVAPLIQDSPLIGQQGPWPMQ